MSKTIFIVAVLILLLVCCRTDSSSNTRRNVWKEKHIINEIIDKK